MVVRRACPGPDGCSGQLAQEPLDRFYHGHVRRGKEIWGGVRRRQVKPWGFQSSSSLGPWQSAKTAPFPWHLGKGHQSTGRDTERGVRASHRHSQTQPFWLSWLWLPKPDLYLPSWFQPFLGMWTWQGGRVI